MAKVTAVVAASAVVDPSDRARLVCQGVGVLELPWWPTELESSGLAPTFTENARVGLAPEVLRSGEPMESLRLAFTVRGDSLAVAATPWLALVRTLAVAHPVVRLLMGRSDRGTWFVSEAGYPELDWTDGGEPAVAEVTLLLKRTDAEIAVGPVSKPKKKSKKKSKKKASGKKTAKPKTKPKTRTKKD